MNIMQNRNILEINHTKTEFIISEFTVLYYQGQSSNGFHQCQIKLKFQYWKIRELNGKVPHYRHLSSLELWLNVTI